jgi:hypothetical protein
MTNPSSHNIIIYPHPPLSPTHPSIRICQAIPTLIQIYQVSHPFIQYSMKFPISCFPIPNAPFMPAKENRKTKEKKTWVPKLHALLPYHTIPFSMRCHCVSSPPLLNKGGKQGRGGEDQSKIKYSSCEKGEVR